MLIIRSQTYIQLKIKSSQTNMSDLGDVNYAKNSFFIYYIYTLFADHEYGLIPR